MILGKLIQETGDLTREELLDIFKNPSLENRAKITDLILSNLQRVNKLEDNDPQLLELIDVMYEEKQRGLQTKSGTSSKILEEVVAKIEKEGLSETPETPQINLSNPLSPPDLEMFSEQKNTNEMSQWLLNLITEHDLSDLGITSSFVTALKEFDEVQKSKQAQAEFENLNYQNLIMGKSGKGVSGPMAVQDEKNKKSVKGYFPANMSLIDRRNQSDMMAEQLAISEMNIRQLRQHQGNSIDHLKGKYMKQRVYRIDPHQGVISREEFVLSNNNVFNIYEEPENEKEIKRILFK